MLFCLSLNSIVWSQQDTIRPIAFTGLPGISSSPETGLTFAAITQLSFDLYRNNLDSRMSQIRFGGGYSVKNQLRIAGGFNLFGRDESYSILGGIDYRDWIDRHYGRGNDASNQIIEYQTEENTIDTLNYLNFALETFRFDVSYVKQLRKGFFVGVQTNIYSAGGFEALADSTVINTDEIDPTNIEGQSYGIGLSMVYDTRDNLNSPRTGAFIRFSNLNYRKWLGGDFEYYLFQLDMRKYINPTRNHTLALRGLMAMTFSDDVIPFNALRRLGGDDELRGYFEGTYLDQHMLYFDVEYRMPLFEDNDEPIWKLWKHMSIAAFFSGGKVYNEEEGLNFSNFRMSFGGGVRFKISKSQRTTLRLDYGIGLADNAGGIGQRQRGFYLSINEAF